MKKIIFLCLSLSVALNLCAQDAYQEFLKRQQSSYNNFKQQAKEQWQTFRDQANADYANFLKESWTPVSAHQAIPAPRKPEPTVQPQKEDDTPAPTQEIAAPKPQKRSTAPQVEPIIPKEEINKAPQTNTPIATFLFYETPCSVHFDKSMRFTLDNATEEAVSEAWTTLSNPSYDQLIKDCIRLKQNLNLGDWGYLLLLRQLTNTFMPNKPNEAVVMQMFILVQSGYQTRIARTDDNRLILLMPFTTNIYNYGYISKDNLKYYILDDNKQQHKYFMFQHKFPQERVASTLNNQTPKLSFTPTQARTLKSKRYPDATAQVTLNRNLLDFYNDYVISSDWQNYARTSLSEETKRVLYPALRKAIDGKDKKTATNILLNFVQTAFAYQTDQQQFGYERPLFPDESLFYPYCDCEDRSILFATLISDLIGLNVILLDYPEHIATAVAFPDNQAYGSYLNVEGRKYTICDPTYIGSSVGDCMPNYKSTTPNVVQIQ